MASPGGATGSARADAHRSTISGMLNGAQDLLLWLLQPKQQKTQQDMNMWMVDNLVSRRMQIISEKDDKAGVFGKRTHRITWGAVSSRDVMASISDRKKKAKSLGFGGGFGGFGMGNKTFHLRKGGAKSATAAKPKPVERQSSGFSVARKQFLFPKELLDPNLTQEQRDAILDKLRADDSVTIIRNSRILMDSNSDVARDVHVASRDALIQSLKAKNTASYIMDGAQFVKRPENKGWHVTCGWLLGRFPSFEAIQWGLARLMNMNLSTLPKSISVPIDGKVKDERKTLRYQGVEYVTRTRTFKIDWKVIEKHMPGLSKTVSRLKSTTVAISDKADVKKLLIVRYDISKKSVIVTDVLKPDGTRVWFSEAKTAGGTSPAPPVPYLDRHRNFVDTRDRFAEPYRLRMLDTAVNVFGLSITLPSISFLIYRKMALGKAPVDGVCLARLEVALVEFHHTTLSRMLGWLLGVDKLFETLIQDYRCSFGLHWDAKDVANCPNGGASLEDVWNLPGTFTTTFEFKCPSAKSSRAQDEMRKQLKKEKYLELENVLGKVFSATSMLMAPDGQLRLLREASAARSKAPEVEL